MDLLTTVRKEGSRGGRGDFKWTDVTSSTHRENYLGHSLMAPVGRWQQGRDLGWYARNDPIGAGEEGGQGQGETAEEKARRERTEEIRLVKEAEQDALARALGYDVPPRRMANPNLEALGDVNGDVKKMLRDVAAEEDGASGDEGKGVGYGKFEGPAGNVAVQERILGDRDGVRDTVRPGSDLQPRQRRTRDGEERRHRRERSRRRRRHRDGDGDRDRDERRHRHRRRRSYSRDQIRDRSRERSRSPDRERERNRDRSRSREHRHGHRKHPRDRSQERDRRHPEPSRSRSRSRERIRRRRSRSRSRSRSRTRTTDHRQEDNRRRNGRRRRDRSRSPTDKEDENGYDGRSRDHRGSRRRD